MSKEIIGLLEKKLQGNVILPSDPSYDESRKVYNGMIDKHPAAIAYCKDVDDVITCVNFARENNMLLAVRSGGHNAGGLGIADDALVIDLSLMKEIRTDKNSETVKVQGGCLLKDLDAATHQIGMTVPSGIFGTTGVAGLTLGGGLGNLTRSFGLSIDNLLEAEVVLANGKPVKASAKENPDLFWALRGGGGNFGVVVSFTFKLCPVHTVYAGPMLWELDDTEEMMTWHHEFINKAPNELSGYFAILTVPPVTPFPEHLHLKKMCGVVWCYAGDMEEAEEVFKPIRAKKTPSLDFVGPMPVPVLQTLFDALYPPGLLWYWKADYVKDLSAEAIKLHVKYGRQLPTPFSTMHMYNISGVAAEVGKNETAWNYRGANYAMVIVGITNDAAEKEKVTNWAKEYWSVMHPYSMGGAYVNFMMDEGADRVKASYGDNYKKLAEVKAKYDPGNLFRVNQNIKPAVV
ncbi:MAG: FAD-binding oxidoreductase [Sphingobacteriales bacterium]|nr:FAD-binding oxidoreductase [Sphingobacteriales bacterium]OJY84496.1 MAG: oxidoreductase [Sphingobacteriales bacterium 44-15]